MTKDNPFTAVIYLAWLPYGMEHFKRFIDSYQCFDADYEHQLVIVFNGMTVAHPDKPKAYLAYLENRGIPTYRCLYYANGQDIEIYRKAAREIPAVYILFFNTYSTILASHWLKYYMQNFDDQTGIIAATGSYQSYYSSVFQKQVGGWEAAKGLLYNFRKYKLFIKAFIYWRFLFKPFPNPHIRTSAFMVKKDIFIELKKGVIDTKFKAYRFENGRNGLTGFYLAKGLKILVVDRFGKTYLPSTWKSSNTFWINNQENLLVADNQTAIYSNATPEEKTEMSRLAWGTK